MIPWLRFAVLAIAVALPLNLTGEPLHAQGGAPATLHPGDLVQIEVWREEDLSGEFLVLPDGVVTLPLIGDVKVTGMPLAAVREEILRRYRLELRNPSINITPLRRVYVLGAVNEPGLHPVDPTGSVAGAVALAGGATPEGDLRRIRIIRDGQTLLTGVRSEAQLSSLDVRSGDQIHIDRRGWVDRNSATVVTSLVTISSILVMLFR